MFDEVTDTRITLKRNPNYYTHPENLPGTRFNVDMPYIDGRDVIVTLPPGRSAEGRTSPILEGEAIDGSGRPIRSGPFQRVVHRHHPRWRSRLVLGFASAAMRRRAYLWRPTAGPISSPSCIRRSPRGHRTRRPRSLSARASSDRSARRVYNPRDLSSSPRRTASRAPRTGTGLATTPSRRIALLHAGHGAICGNKEGLLSQVDRPRARGLRRPEAGRDVPWRGTASSRTGRTSRRRSSRAELLKDLHGASSRATAAPGQAVAPRTTLRWAHV